jgi:hypothetical protein
MVLMALQEAAALDAAAIRGVGNKPAPAAATSGFVRTKAASYYGYDLWAGTTGGPDRQLVLVRLGWQSFSAASATAGGKQAQAGKGGKDQALTLTAEVSVTNLNGLVSTAAAGSSGSGQQLHYCSSWPQTDSKPNKETLLPGFTECRAWQPAANSVLGDLLQLSCSACRGAACQNMSVPTKEEARLLKRDQAVEQAAASFEAQRQTATTASATVVAVTSAGSAAATFVVTSMAAQAAVALGAKGGQAGLQGALASVGTTGLINHLQIFALTGQGPAGMHERHCSSLQAACISQSLGTDSPPAS